MQDVEMNLSEIEEALQQINGHLMSEKEMQYIYHVRKTASHKRTVKYSVSAHPHYDATWELYYNLLLVLGVGPARTAQN